MGDWVLTPEGQSSITLPTNPITVTDENTAEPLILELPGELPFVLSFGKGARKLDLRGWLYVPGQSASYIETNYLNPLRTAIHKKVTISAPDSRYDGDWILVQFTYEEVGGIVAAFQYSMRFIMGSIQVVL